MRCEENFSLKQYNSYRVDCKVARAWFPESIEDVLAILDSTTDFRVLGHGNNSVLVKEYYDEDFIVLNGCLDHIELSAGIIRAGSGASFHDLSNFALENSLTGLEFAFDIPSSVGGGVVMNAGTAEGTISEVLCAVTCVDIQTKKVERLTKDELQLVYRSSIFQVNSDKVILEAEFELSLGDFDEISEVMEASKSRRWEKQPRDLPNCGSVFKRPAGRFVGPMIREIGIESLAVGDARVSEKHAGFIVNMGNASGLDIFRLIGLVREKVSEKFGVSLEVEQRLFD
jgi:UDP-N-acetylmuramate dehydrogenase